MYWREGEAITKILPMYTAHAENIRMIFRWFSTVAIDTVKLMSLKEQ